MSRRCSFELETGRRCKHPVASYGQGRMDCGRHTIRLPGADSDLVVAHMQRGGCQIVELQPQHWKCLVHAADGWDVAQALGADIRCGPLPLGEERREKMAASPTLDIGTATILARDPQVRVRRALIANDSGVPPEALAILVDDKDVANVVLLIDKRRLPDSLCDRLARRPENAIARALAGSESTPPSILERLSQHPDVSARNLVANNPGTPQHALEELFAHCTTAFRISVAGNRAAPEHLLRRLRLDDAGVAESLSRNPSAPADLLEALSASKDKVVEVRLAANPSITPQAARILFRSYSNPRVPFYLAKNPRAPLDVLHGIAKLHTRSADLNLLDRSDLPIDIVLQLARSNDNMVSETASAKIAKQNGVVL